MLLLGLITAFSLATEPDDEVQTAGPRLVADVGISAQLSLPGEIAEVPIGVEAGWQSRSRVVALGVRAELSRALTQRRNRGVFCAGSGRSGPQECIGIRGQVEGRSLLMGRFNGNLGENWAAHAEVGAGVLIFSDNVDYPDGRQVDRRWVHPAYQLVVGLNKPLSENVDYVFSVVLNGGFASQIDFETETERSRVEAPTYLGLRLGAAWSPRRQSKTAAATASPSATASSTGP
ncbi:MAG: hypothetical protein AB8H79_07140 [Myxococcota bacterium]